IAKGPVATDVGATKATKPTEATPRGSLLFGACAGLVLGALTGATCCWLVDTVDFFWRGVIIGAGLGPCAGAFLGYLEQSRRGGLGRPDIATHTGAILGLMPGVLIALSGAGTVSG